MTPIEGNPPLPLDDGQADRFIANYVLDLMSPDDALRWLNEAHRILAPSGLLCLVSITPGTGRAARLCQIRGRGSGLADRLWSENADRSSYSTYSIKTSGQHSTMRS